MTKPLPLSGLTVIEIGHTVAAPYAGMILAELGADVIKIESPGGGDYSRGMPPFREDGTASMFQTLNRGKRSVVIDMKDPEEATMLRELIKEKGDVLIHNLKFGAMDKLGFSAAELLATRPSLVYCNLGAFGHTGPLRDKPGYDPLIQAFTGIMSIMGEDNRPPVRVGVAITDMAAGLWAVIGIQAACREAALTGKGGVVDTSLFETALGWLSIQYASFDVSGKVPRREGSGVAMLVPYQAFETSDLHIMVAAGNDNIFRRLCHAVGHPAWESDERFALNKDRCTNRIELISLLGDIFKQKSSEEWLVILETAGVPASPINTINQLVDNPQTKALEILQASPDGNGTVLGLPLSFDAVRPPFRTPAPKLGEHTHEVFASIRARLVGGSAS
jgi:crotonobetainyl-CoA:carnitine CoA-transferase CaiB-like acyl-CoA transferase